MFPLIAIASLALVSAAFLFARARLNDDEVPISHDLFAPGAPRKVLCVWAHPDDEIVAAGTLSALTQSGADLTLVYLTAGEASRDTGYGREDLARLRRAEAAEAGRLLGATHVEVLDFPDGGLAATDPQAAKTAVGRLIDRFAPSLVISFDDRIGFYGHPDHAAVGRWVRELLEADPGPVRRLYQATLPRALISLALKHVQAFRDNYPTDPARQLPAPTVAVKIASQAATKRDLLDVHASQAKVIADVQPYHDAIPALLYYRLLDREYFALAMDR